jgi:hypothetical protein
MMRVSEYPFNLELLVGRMVKWVPDRVPLLPTKSLQTHYRIISINPGDPVTVDLIDPTTGEEYPRYRYLWFLEILNYRYLRI